MSENQDFLTYSDDNGRFQSRLAAYMREIYMPLCAPTSAGIKSAITPFLSGDIKIDKSSYVTKPVSRQDLRNPLRNFFIRTEDGDVFSLLDREDDDAAKVEVGQLWHKLINRSKHLGLELESLNFVPVGGEHVELMKVTVRNISDKVINFSPIGCIPVFGRSLVNKHDHEHVTSLLHRTEQIGQGIIVYPTMMFNEEGHTENHQRYVVLGAGDDGALPRGSFATVDEFLGDSGTFNCPEAVVLGLEPVKRSARELDGKEVAGAICFDQRQLKPGNEASFILMIGILGDQQNVDDLYQHFNSKEKFDQAFDESVSFWAEKSGSITVKTADRCFDSWMRWVTIQPVLRRIFGCSFLPDHDYGKGGKGWRDLWQDLLSLILIEPEQVRENLIGNFGGVRIDGSNATIIGTKKGEFIADRNAISRVWMDHGAWPVLTMMLYIDQTGDLDILLEKNSYFRDFQLARNFKKDRKWKPEDGNQLKLKKGKVYEGTLLEHMLVQTLTQFFNVGEHHMLRLESADWNDGLDMAFNRGESVAFSSFYAENLLILAEMIRMLKNKKGLKKISVFKELTLLLDPIGDDFDYELVEDKQRILFDKYYAAVDSGISGKMAHIDSDQLRADLRRKAGKLFLSIRQHEKVAVNHDGRKYEWFNGYYDNKGKRVEGKKDGRIHMTLTGQVFAIMSNLAQHQEIQEVIASVDTFLKDPLHGGYRLNTDFGKRNYLDLGRAFSFAYGTKENGAVFSHMTTMYAYALYKRGFAREGFQVLDSLYQMSTDFSRSKIYPNLPEYFDNTGRGMYSYLTGSASWMVLMILTQVFGIRGDGGNLLIDPKLVAEQFSTEGKAEIKSTFAGKSIDVIFHNPLRLDYQHYQVASVKIDGADIDPLRRVGSAVCLDRAALNKKSGKIIIDVELLESTL